jgi:hypothetical protein
MACALGVLRNSGFIYAYKFNHQTPQTQTTHIRLFDSAGPPISAAYFTPNSAAPFSHPTLRATSAGRSPSQVR